MWQTLLDYLFPRVSLSGKEGSVITDAEWRDIRSWPIVLETPELRRRGIRSVDRIVAASTYDSSPLLCMAVQRLKYRRVSALVDSLGTLLIDASHLFTSEREMILCPVPLHWTRMFTRGFNQSALLAHIVADARHWKTEELLTRTRPTGFQAHRSKKERWLAMRNAFACRTHHVPERVILVDDVSTTGATLDACAAALKEHGVQRIEALVIALG